MTFLTDEKLYKVAPSIFAQHKHPNRSERYTYVPTLDIVNGLRREGFMPTWAGQSKTRKEDQVEFTRHMIRFRHVDAPRSSGMVPEMVLKNSHNGASQYEMYAGLFRFICANGVICGDLSHEPMKVPHKGDIIGKIIEGTFKVVQDAQAALEESVEWQGIELTRPMQLEYAKAAQIIRFEKTDENGVPFVDTSIPAERLIEPRRVEDAGNDLLRLFHRTQENAVRGGLGGFNRQTNRRVTSREVQGIEGNIALNRALHSLTVGMANILKGGA